MHGREAILLGSLCITTIDHGAPRRKGPICSVSCHMMDWSFAHARPERDRDDDHTLHITCACITRALKRGVLSACACACKIYVRATQRWGFAQNEWNKWKNHFYEMKGDVGMSLHEKERNKKMPTQDTKSLITPSLHLCFFQDYNVHFHAGNWMSRCCAVCFA